MNCLQTFSQSRNFKIFLKIQEFSFGLIFSLKCLSYTYIRNINRRKLQRYNYWLSQMFFFHWDFQIRDIQQHYGWTTGFFNVRVGFILWGRLPSRDVTLGNKQRIIALGFDFQNCSQHWPDSVSVYAEVDDHGHFWIVNYPPAIITEFS